VVTQLVCARDPSDPSRASPIPACAVDRGFRERVERSWGGQRSRASRSRNNAWCIPGPVRKSDLMGPLGFIRQKIPLAEKAFPETLSRGVQNRSVQRRGGKHVPSRGNRTCLGLEIDCQFGHFCDVALDCCSMAI